MNDSLKNKTYLIAGGSKGIGLALTQQLATAGATVHVYSRSIGDLSVTDNVTPVSYTHLTLPTKA